MAPVVLLQGIVTYVFFERDLDTTTGALARDVAADMAFWSRSRTTTAGAGARRAARAWRRGSCATTSRFHAGASMLAARGAAASTIDEALDDVIAQQIGAGRHFVTSRDRR